MTVVTHNQDLPFSVPDEVERFLQRTFPDGYEITGWSYLKGDASDRRYIRVNSASSKGVRGTFVLMQLAEPWAPQEGREELPFVNIARHLAEKGVPVPTVFLDASRKGFVLLEDVGDATLEMHLQACSPEERRRCYLEAVEILVKMQREASRPSSLPCYALDYAFDAETFFRELRFFVEYALESLWKQRISPFARVELEARFMELCEELARYPQTFTHRDYHARNFMVRDSGLTVLDFQDARMGPVTYDLVSLLRDSYVHLDPGEQQALITHYREMCSSEGTLLPGPDEFNKAFRRTAVQRNLKAMGTFAYQAVAKGNETYLVSMRNTMRSLRMALEADPGLTPLHKVLKSYMEGL